MNKNDAEETLSDAPLTPQECKRLRTIIRADDRARWAWSSARTLAIWVVAVTTAIAVVRSFVLDSFLGKHP